MSRGDLRQRTKAFALAIVRFRLSERPSEPWRVLSNQLLRSGTSVGANYREACRSRSRAEFVAKVGVALEEADESCYWLEILMESGMTQSPVAATLLEEANQLCAMLVASLITAKRNRCNPPEENSAL